MILRHIKFDPDSVSDTFSDLQTWGVSPIQTQLEILSEEIRDPAEIDDLTYDHAERIDNLLATLDQLAANLNEALEQLFLEALDHKRACEDHAEKSEPHRRPDQDLCPEVDQGKVDLN